MTGFTGATGITPFEAFNLIEEYFQKISDFLTFCLVKKRTFRGKKST
jgi:hypothetical protein